MGGVEVDEMFIIFPESLENGLQEDEVRKALRDYDQRCGKYDPDHEEQLIVLSAVGNEQRVILVVLEFLGGQQWWVFQAKAANEDQTQVWKKCIEKRKRQSQWEEREKSLSGILRRFLPRI
jgi:hypothetical protein